MYRLNKQLVSDDGKALEKLTKVEESGVTKIPAGSVEPGHTKRFKPPAIKDNKFPHSSNMMSITSNTNIG